MNPYLSDSDVKLMLEFQKGDVASFEVLLKKFFPRILNFIYRFVHDRQLAEDLTQEVFIKVYKQAQAYVPKAQFKTWLFTIAKNTSLNELRRKGRVHYSLDDGVDIEGSRLERQVEDKGGLRPDQALLDQEKASAVEQVINSLPEKQRMVVVLRRYEQFSYEEIAKTMSCSTSAVKSLLSRARETLKGKLSYLFNNK